MKDDVEYFPYSDDAWARAAPAGAGLDPARLQEAVAFAESRESSWPRDLEKAGDVPGLSQFERPPWNEALGPFKPRGGPAGLVLKGGRIAAEWGDMNRVDMTFSVAKSYLAVLAGLAIGDGLVGGVDDPVSETVSGNLFASKHNRAVTWRHLLTQTSEWEGTLFDKPDLVDRNRQVGPGSDNSRKGEHRDLKPPGSFWEYNDVRVNVLALALLHVFRKPLPDVLASRIMEPIGASDTWRWLGYRNSFVEIGGVRMQSVPGGTHWGGGIRINNYDHARFALLVHRDGVWNGSRLLPEGWTAALRSPSKVNSGYGYLWWLNTGRREWPGAPESAYAAVGAGSHIILIEPGHDIVLIARWIDQDAVGELVARVFDSLA